MAKPKQNSLKKVMAVGTAGVAGASLFKGEESFAEKNKFAGAAAGVAGEETDEEAASWEEYNEDDSDEDEEDPWSPAKFDEE